MKRQGIRKKHTRMQTYLFIGYVLSWHTWSRLNFYILGPENSDSSSNITNIVSFPCLNSPIQVKILQSIFFGQFIWNILYTIWILKGGYRGSPPFLAPSEVCIGFSIWIFRKKCPVAFQWPEVDPPVCEAMVSCLFKYGYDKWALGRSG